MRPPGGGVILVRLLVHASALTVAVCVQGCTGTIGDSFTPTPTDQLESAGDPPRPELRRLTREQYTSSLTNLLGVAILEEVDVDLEVDTPVRGFTEVGASEVVTSRRGVEQYEAAAIDVAARVIVDAALRGRVIGCTPSAPEDATCAQAFVARFGRQLFRRPLDQEEIDSYVALYLDEAMGSGSSDIGLEAVLAGLLQSPNFLYLVDIGEPDPAEPGRYRFTNYEMASRLSYFLWNTTPDEALLDSAERGELVTLDGLRAQAIRLASAPRAEAVLLQFFIDFLGLGPVRTMSKDSDTFPDFTSTLRNSMAEETRRLITHFFIEGDVDYRELFVTRTTFVDEELATFYSLTPPPSGFERVELPEDSPRVGILGHAGVLARYAHGAENSPTHRGLFVRSQLLCTDIALPSDPTDAVLSDEVDPTVRTLRQRLSAHAEEPSCARCHQFMDPIGFAMEHFDAVGRFRRDEDGEPIDASGDLDGVAVDGLAELAQVVHGHHKLGSCLARTLLRRANGRTEVGFDADSLESLAARFEASGHRVGDLVMAVVTADSFRFARPRGEERGAEEK